MRKSTLKKALTKKPSVVLPIRIPDEDYKTIVKAAETLGVSASKFMRQMALLAASNPCKTCYGTGSAPCKTCKGTGLR